MALFISEEQWRLKKKKKKLLLKKKNKRHEMLFQLMRLRRAEAERVKALDAAARKKPQPQSKKSASNPAWGDKVAKVRNRLTGKKRASKERWNRFAGTSGAGGRGL